ncbi:helix-turn-helix domain-containing protein [Oscillospiraceae bacterium OttesenSCG-928-G22]|nr:helix-turn-helix domain-containing protein [Oscillospiraceae bacterium OttesenSCG-928-G22]
MDKKLFGIRIREAREKAGMSINNLAQKLSINSTSLRNIEAGSRLPSLPVFAELCAALEVSPAILLYGAECNPDELSFMDRCERLTPKQREIIKGMMDVLSF